MAKEGWKLVSAATLLAFVFFFLSWSRGWIVAFLFAIVFSLFTLFLIFSFRDPKRIIPDKGNIILSPADGHIAGMEELPSTDFLKVRSLKIGIFMSLFDVHINRLPVSGEIKYVKHKAGKFLPAFLVDSSERNAQTEVGIENPFSRIILRQIVGFTARRIICRLKAGDKVNMGDKFGMIRFGSRVELVVPSSVELKVKLKDRVKAGETLIGVFKNEG